MYCQLETLRHCLPPSVRSSLDELPETLDETYERVLRDINKTNRDHAHRLLQCLTVAIRPLRVEELAEVMSVDFDAAQRDGIPKLNPDWRWEDQHQAVLSTCSSLIITVDDGGFQVVQFSHFSVKEFLTSERLASSSGDISRYHVHLKPAHTILAQACLGVLLDLDDQVNQFNVKDLPLVEYAAQHWVDHAQFENVSSSIQAAMEYFFDAGKPHWAAWLRVYNMDTSWLYFGHSSGTDGGPLYYAALCGFYNLVEHLVAEHPQDINAKGGRNKTPMVAALYGEHFQVAELLHQHGADIDERDNEKCTSLHIASMEGLVDVTQWLLGHGANVNVQQDELWTPLHLATINGHLEVAQMLLEHKADIHTRNGDGRVALHLASGPYTTRDQLEITQLLLCHGAYTNVLDDTGSTPLHESLSNSTSSRTTFKPSAAVIRLLLKHGANMDVENNEGKTPLQIASEEGYHEILELLLEHGAKNTQYGYGSM